MSLIIRRKSKLQQTARPKDILIPINPHVVNIAGSPGSGSEDQGLGHSVGTAEDRCELEEGHEADIEDFDAQERVSVNTSINTSVDVSHIKVSFTEKSTHNQTTTFAK